VRAALHLTPPPYERRVPCETHHTVVGHYGGCAVGYVLCRIEDDSSLTSVSEHEEFVDGVTAGKHKVEVEDFDFSYGLYSDGLKVASFAEGRIGYREWARRSGRLEYIHSLDDRYDHDVDELMA
jgi:hypothetical protein